MKFTHTIILSLLVLAVCATAKRLPTHEVLPAPVLIHPVKGNPNKYIAESVWYANGYHDNGMLKTFTLYSNDLFLFSIFMKIKIQSLLLKTFFVEKVDAIFRCEPPVIVNATDQVKW